MLKQVKIFHRYEAVDYPRRRGLLREVMLTQDEEHRPMIRAKRGREFLLEIGCISHGDIDIDFYLHRSRRDQKSWKSRCKKRHQWEKHRHTKSEYAHTDYYNAEKCTDKLYRSLQGMSGEFLLDMREDFLLQDAIDLLEHQHVLTSRRPYPEYWDDPLRLVKLTGKHPYQEMKDKEDTLGEIPPQSDRHRYEKRHHHTGKLPHREWLFGQWNYAKTRRKKTRRTNLHLREFRCKEKQPPVRSPYDIFENFYRSLPHSVRRHWRYRQWESVIVSNSPNRTGRYVELLGMALKRRLEVMFQPHDPQRNPYAEFFWNMAGEEQPFFAGCPRKKLPHGAAQFKTWAMQTFFRFPLPPWANHLLFRQCSNKDSELLVKWSEGVSPRRLWRLSKKENGFFHTLPCGIPSLRYALIVSACRAKGCSMHLANAIAGAFIEHIGPGAGPSLSLKEKKTSALYETVLTQSRYLGEWFANIGDAAVAGAAELIDFLFAEHYILCQTSLKHRTLKSLKAEMMHWHERLALAKAGSSNWPPHGLSCFFPEDEVRFEEIYTAKRLHEEGQHQHNCVASYLRRCMQLRCAIVSMRQMSGGARTTIEVRLSDRNIVQAKGACNRPPNYQESRFIRQYAREKELGISCKLCA